MCFLGLKASEWVAFRSRADTAERKAAVLLRVVSCLLSLLFKAGQGVRGKR